LTSNEKLPEKVIKHTNYQNNTCGTNIKGVPGFKQFRINVIGFLSTFFILEFRIKIIPTNPNPVASMKIDSNPEMCQRAEKYNAC
jgi:hypothetical protein